MLPALSDLVDLFSSVDGSERLELLIEFGDRLPILPEPYRRLRDAGQYMIHECQSPVFFCVNVRENRLSVHADVAREAPIARGFTGLLYETFDDVPVTDVVKAPRDLLDPLGLTDLLTLQRRRGLTAIYRRLLEPR